MKKIIVLLLLAFMCFSLVACGNKAEKEIVGEWKSDDFFGRVSTFTFKKDGTGTIKNFSSSGLEEEFKWKYDTDLSLYTVVLDDGQPINISIKENEDEMRYISIVGAKFYYVED